MVGKFIAHLQHDVRVYWLSLGIQFRAASHLRGAFISQIIGMILNNACLAGAWMFFFHYFGSVNGWGMTDFIGLMGINSFVFGLTSCLAVGLMDLPRHVDSGSLDSYLTKPTSVLGGVASSNADVTTVGDMLFGLTLIGWYALHINPELGAFLASLVAIVAGCITFFCFALLLPNIVAFYVFDGERLGRYLGVLFLDAGFYPSGVLTGAFRMVLLTALPALLFAVVPLDALRGVNLEWAGLSLAVAVIWLVISLWLFRRALRRYESANLIGAR